MENLAEVFGIWLSEVDEMIRTSFLYPDDDDGAAPAGWGNG